MHINNFFKLIIAIIVSELAGIIGSVFTTPAAAWLLLPYILWVSFAGYLNYLIWVSN